MASGSITWRQIDGETMETVTDFIFLGSKIIADGDYSQEIKMFAHCKKSYGKPRQHIKKQRHCQQSIVKAMVFPVFMDGCESWTMKKSEWWKIAAFELQFCRRLWRVPCTSRRASQSILKEINPELEGQMLKLKLQYYLPRDV